MLPVEPLAIARLVIGAIERVGARYSIGGSLASSFAGEPRSSLDIDLLADLTPAQFLPLLVELRDAFYVSPEAFGRAVADRGTVNPIHEATSTKIDVFIAGGTPLGGELLRRRQT